MVLKLYYFAMPGLAEPSRVALAVGKIPFEDVRFSGHDDPAWVEFKPTTPFGTVPVLVLDDGKVLAQSGAILRYVSRLAGLYPEDPWHAAQADQACFLMQETFDPMMPTFRMQDAEERIKARQELLAGPLKPKFEAVSRLVEKSGDFIAGDKLSYGDISIYTSLSLWTSGMMDGVPKTLLDDYPVLKAYRTRIAQLPGIVEYYADATGLREAFKP